MQAIALVFVVALVGTLILGWMSYEGVDEGYVGVEKEYGAVTGDVHGPGANFVNPVTTDVQHVETRPRAYTMSDTKGEGDKASRADAIPVETINGTTVRVDVTVRYRVDKNEADTFVTEWNDVKQAEARLIRPTIRSEIRNEASRIATTQIFKSVGRHRLADAARSALLSEFDGEAVTLERVQIREVNLPKSLDKALERKEVTKQERQRKAEEIAVERKEAKRKKIEAEADAEVTRIRGEALRENPIVLRREQIEAYDKGTVYVVPQNASTPVMLDGAKGGA